MNLLEKYPAIKFQLDSVGNIGSFNNKGTIYYFLDSLEEIPEKKVNNSKKSIGKHLSSDEIIFLLFDDTLFGSATDGTIFTNRNIHVKGLFEEAEVIPYEEIDSISVSRKNGKLHLSLGDKTKVIGASGVTDFMTLFSLSQFIIGMSYLIRANNEGIEVENAEEFIFDAYCNNVKFEGEPDKFEEFLNKHQDTIRDLVEKLGINDLLVKLEEDDESWNIVIDKLYELLPAPVRLVISRDKLRSFVLENKNTFLKRLGG